MVGRSANLGHNGLALKAKFLCRVGGVHEQCGGTAAQPGRVRSSWLFGHLLPGAGQGRCPHKEVQEDLSRLDRTRYLPAQLPAIPCTRGAKKEGRKYVDKTPQ
jgi:hypothetical protein